MKCTALTLVPAIALHASIAVAQAPEVPTPKCDPKPEYPGRHALQNEGRRRVYDRDIKNFETCMKAYIEERKAVIFAHDAAARAAIEDYNSTVAKLNKEREEDR